jgi:hypothetical protein
MLQSVQHYTLHTGRICEHRSYRVRVITALHYHVLVFEQTPEPTLAEQQEMLGLALEIAQRASLARLGHADGFLLIHNGPGSRRRRNFHCHIVPVSGRIEKTTVYAWLTCKNLFHFAWLLTRNLRRGLMRR